MARVTSHVPKALPKHEMVGAEAGPTIVRNLATGAHHIMAEGRLACGKDAPLQWAAVEHPPPGARLCSRCF